MNFKQRKTISDLIIKYVKSEYCCIEHLMGLKIVIQALDVAVDRRLQELIKQRNKLQSKIRNTKEDEWLD